jgi:endo-1,4-beta-xylanase
VAVTQNEISADRQELIKQQFNSLTPGNELKPDSVLDYAACASKPEIYNESPAVKFDSMGPIFKFAKDNGIVMRGHTLVWHSQTPRWFFAEGYSAAANAPLVSKELMQKRLENYIRQVMEYTQKNYPGMIYAWDVVNEAINSDGAKDDYRSKDSLWYQIIGPDYIEKAFEYARKYAAKDVKLFYNDYNTEDPGKMMSIYNMLKGLKEKGLVDGIGLQSHIAVSSPSLINVESSIRKYSELGLEIQITELDMDMAEKTGEALMNQAKRYKRLFTMLKFLDESAAANITNVTFWGLSDDISWLIKPDKDSYPLLFDQYLVQKPAFWGVVLSPDIPLY